jgi:P-type Cu2+ transporter
MSVATPLTSALPTKTVTLDVSGMMCAGCVSAVTRKLKQQPGVQGAIVNLLTEVATVTTTGNLPTETLTNALTQAGFPSTARSRLPGQGRTEQLADLTQRRTQQSKTQRQRLAIALFLVIVSSAGHIGHSVGHPLPGLGNDGFHAVLAGLALVIPGREILRDGLKGLVKNAPNMNSLIALGSLLAFGTSLVALLNPAIGWECFFDEPVMLIGFILLGRSLEGWARREALSSFQALIELQPQNARLVGQSLESETSQIPSEAIVIPVEHLRIGEWVQVLPGEQIPIDGIMIQGSTTLNESMLTGEALPVEKSPGDRLSAGTLNQGSPIVLEVTQVGNNTQLAKIIQWVEGAQTHPAPIQQLADRIAGYFTYGVLTLSVLTFFGWYCFGQSVLLNSQSLMPAMDHMSSMASNSAMVADRLPPSPLLMSLKLAISLMVVACPCALGLAIPTALIVGSSLGAQRGLLIRGGDILQQVDKLDTIVFDKTGTLTLGQPELIDRIPTDANIHPDRLLQLAATLESGTQHPLATAILQAAHQSNLPILPTHQSKTIAGCGVQATVDNQSCYLGTSSWLILQGVEISQTVLQQADQFGQAGKTVIFLAQETELLGLLTVSDTLRPEAKATVRSLQDQGLRVMLLTGDRTAVAQGIARQVGIPIDQVIAEVLPAEKAAAIAQLQSQGHVVAMIGDGINDAPALAQADVGIALKGGTEVASETAGIVLLNDRLSDVLAALDLSRNTLQTIYLNLCWAIVYNLVAIPISAGLLLPRWNLVLTPGQAGILMAVSSITVVGNSILLRWRTTVSSNVLLKSTPRLR